MKGPKEIEFPAEDAEKLREVQKEREKAERQAGHFLVEALGAATIASLQAKTFQSVLNKIRTEVNLDEIDPKEQWIADIPNGKFIRLSLNKDKTPDYEA